MPLTSSMSPTAADPAHPNAPAREPALSDPGMGPGEARVIRAVLFAGAAVNLIFWVARDRLSLGGLDPLWQRLVLSAACVAIGAATWGGPASRRFAAAGVQFIAYAGTVWWTHQVAQSGLKADFAVGSLLPPAILGLLFRRPWQHLVFSLFSVVVAAVEYASVPAPGVPVPLLILALATILVVMHLQIRTRLRAREELAESESLRAALAAQTTDALILLDPKQRTAFEANGGARLCLGAGTAGDLAVLGNAVEALIGPAGWRDVERDLAAGGVFRRNVAWTDPAGVARRGELTVSPERVGRRAAWLVRISGPGCAMLPGAAVEPPDGAEDLRPEELRMYRVVFAVGGAILPAFWILRRAEGLAGGDPLWQRLVVSAVCFAAAFATFGPRRVRGLVRQAVPVIAVLVTLWWIHRVALTGLRPDYAVGLMVAPAIVGGGIHRPGVHLLYSLVVLAAAGLEFGGLPGPWAWPGFVLLCLATMLGLMHVLLRRQLVAYDDLLAGEDLREIMFERTAEGLALADPLRADILMSNGRARELLGAAPGPSASLLGGLVTGGDELRLVDLLAVTREIAEHGAFRRPFAGRTPAGREFAGEVAVTSAWSGHRAVWLIRVAERAPAV